MESHCRAFDPDLICVGISKSVKASVMANAATFFPNAPLF